MKTQISKLKVFVTVCLLLFGCSTKDTNVQPAKPQANEVIYGNVKMSFANNIFTVASKPKGSVSARESNDLFISNVQFTYSPSGVLTQVNVSGSSSVALNSISITPSQALASALGSCPCIDLATAFINKFLNLSSEDDRIGNLNQLLNDLVAVLDCLIANNACSSGISAEDLEGLKAARKSLEELKNTPSF